MGVLTRVDRRLGRAIRDRVAARTGVARTVRGASVLLAPAFEGLVAALIVERPTRAVGLRAGAAAVAAATAAKLLRDTIGRPRPGDRTDGGFPSRHAAAAVAIARSIGRANPGAGGVLAAAAALGLLGRIATSEHDPADIVAGAGLGLAAEWTLHAARERVASD